MTETNILLVISMKIAPIILVTGAVIIAITDREYGGYGGLILGALVFELLGLCNTWILSLIERDSK